MDKYFDKYCNGFRVKEGLDIDKKKLHYSWDTVLGWIQIAEDGLDLHSLCIRVLDKSVAVALKHWIRIKDCCNGYKVLDKTTCCQNLIIG